MGKSHYGTPKQAGGIRLIPALWKRIEDAADVAGVTKTQVMEVALMRAFGFAEDLQKTRSNGRKVQIDNLPGLRDD